jgi:hypothetical protein
MQNLKMKVKVFLKLGHKKEENHQKKDKPSFINKMIQNKEKVVAGFISSSSKEEISQNVVKKLHEKFEFLRKYFDVNVEDIQSKLLSTLNPMNTKFQELAEKTPDLYGPFWIYSTLVFLVAVAGNLSGYMNSTASSNFKYDFNMVPLSAFYVTKD